MPRRMWITVIVVAAVVVASIFVWRIAPPLGGSGGPPIVQIGVILPLTGNAASLGKPTLNGMQLAIDQYNAEKPAEAPAISLVVEDDQGQPAKAVAAFQKLNTASHVRLVLGPLTSGCVLAVAPQAERNKTVILSPGASAPAVTNAGDYIFRNELSEALGARAQAELAVSRLRLKSIAILYVNNEYGLGTTTVFHDRFTELGGRILAEEGFSAGTTDFKSSLEKIAVTKPEAIFVVFEDQIGNILKQRSELGITIPVYTTPVFEDPGNLKNLGRLAEGVVYTFYGTFSGEAKAGPAVQFVTSYTQRFGEPPSYYAALGYDAANIEIAALRAAEFDTAKVKDAMYGISEFPGITGETSFDHNGDVTKPIILKVVRDGRFVSY